MTKGFFVIRSCDRMEFVAGVNDAVFKVIRVEVALVLPAAGFVRPVHAVQSAVANSFRVNALSSMSRARHLWKLAFNIF